MQMKMRSKRAAALAAVLCAPLAAHATAAADPHQGWGLAISYEVIGEKCSGALSSDDVEVVKRFVAEGLAQTKAEGGTFDADKFAADFRTEMVARYSEPANCTDAAIKGARDAVATLRQRGM